MNSTVRLSPGLLSAACATLLAAGCVPDSGKYGSYDEALCPAGGTLEGVDVSEFQGNINWTAVHNSGRAFAIARVSDGTGHPDPTFNANWSGMKAAGMVRGVYQFFRPTGNATAQADLLVARVGKLGNGDLPAVADVEVGDGASQGTLIANLHTWVDIVRQGTGKEPMIYTSPGLWSSLAGGTGQFGNQPLWVANWRINCPGLPSGWNSFKVWQYDDMGSVPGIPANVDRDKFNGDQNALNAFAGGGITAPKYAAKFVMQSFPYAMTAFNVPVGQSVPASIELMNTGTATWDGNTRLGTTVPRDRSSAFADGTWLSPNRAAGVKGTVPPGGTFKFQFDFHGPANQKNYLEYFDLVQEGVAWFSDPGQGGPPDDQLEANINVVPGPPPMPDMATAPQPDLVTPASPDLVTQAPSDLAGMIATDDAAGTPSDDSGAVASGDLGTTPSVDALAIHGVDATGGTTSVSGNCACAIGARPAKSSPTLWMVFVLSAFVVRRRRAAR